MLDSKITIVIPTFNNEKDLPVCLTSIKKQKYPNNKVEVLICDGGSTDNTLNIADKFHYRVIHNRKRLAEYGVALGFEKAEGDFITILAADNELQSFDFLTEMVIPFKNENVMVTYPKQVSDEKDSWIASYLNTFTDPINHFIYGNAANTRTFKNAYPLKEKNKEYVIYQFSPIDYPMLAFAQGTTVRKSFIRRKSSFGDDLLPIVELIEKGYDLAYVPQALVIHHTMKSTGEFIRKQRWAIDNYLLEKKYGIRSRRKYFSKERKIRQLVWPFYAASFIFPLLVSLKGILLDRERNWIYHSMLTYLVFWLMVLELFRIKVFKKGEVLRKK